jgi:ABC-type glycerol-3-phosphate transport system substrate-binding protein
MKKFLAFLLCCTLILPAFSGCSLGNSYKKNDALASSGDVTLTLTGSSSSFKAMESVITAFNKIYPNCTINYEYVQDYEKSMTTRLANNDSVDLFMTDNITSDSPFKAYALELSGQSDKLDLSDTSEGLIRNFTIPSTDTSTGSALYAIPLGGEIRGMYVNKTLLASLGLKTPTNYSELMACCKTLKDAGYTPLQGNPGTFGQQLMYPYTCNLIANASDYQSTYDAVNRCDTGVSTLFSEPMSRLYEMVADGYYDYKTVETQDKTFLNVTEDTTAKAF